MKPELKEAIDQYSKNLSKNLAAEIRREFFMEEYDPSSAYEIFIEIQSKGPIVRNHFIRCVNKVRPKFITEMLETYYEKNPKNLQRGNIHDIPIKRD